MNFNQETNAVKFGKYGIVLEKEQLSYYCNGQLSKVADVSHEFNNKDLFTLAKKIADKNQIAEVEFTYKHLILRNSYETKNQI